MRPDRPVSQSNGSVRYFYSGSSGSGDSSSSGGSGGSGSGGDNS